MVKDKSPKKPKVGFLTIFDSYGETYSLVEIAKKYINLGGKVVFIGYGKKYKNLAEKLDCKIIKVDTKKLNLDIFDNQISNENYFSFFSSIFDKKREEINMAIINKEIEIFKKEKIQLIVSSYVFNSHISARVCNIPLIFLSPGVSTPWYYKSNNATFPENFENFITYHVPKKIKNRLTNWYALRSKTAVKDFNQLAEKYDVAKLNHFLDFFCGDFTLIPDDMYFLNLNNSDVYPSENFVGPLFNGDKLCIKKNDNFHPSINKYLHNSKKTILLTMGSSSIWKELFKKILATLNSTNFNIIATYTNILKKNELPKLDNNILLKKFIPNISSLHQKVDLSIIHGGRGTVYAVAYSGKPAIGIPLHAEQQFNIDNLVNHEMALRISNIFFKEEKLLNAIDKIFNNYNFYLKNAEKLKDKLPPPNGSENAANRIISIYNNFL